MRVLIDYRPALRQRTGVGEYAHQLAAALTPRLRPDGALVLFSSSWKDRLQAEIPGALPLDRRIPVRLLNYAWHRWEWPPAEMLAGPLDVVHAMHPLLIPSRRAAQVITINDLYFLDHPESTEAEIRRDYHALAGSHAHRADGIVVISRYTAAQVQSRLNVAASRIAICTPGAPAWPRRDRDVPDGAILFVGTLEPRKNAGTLLTAYARLAERRPGVAPLLLAGRATATSAALLRRLDDPPLAGRVHHLGYVTGERLRQLYEQASLFVFPSFDEGFGMPALEAMTIGLPVVASNRGALPEVVGDAGLLVDPDDDAGMAAAMERMLDDPGVRRRCIEAGAERSRRFSWEASADVLVQAYRAAVERRASRTS